MYTIISAILQQTEQTFIHLYSKVDDFNNEKDDL